MSQNGSSTRLPAAGMGPLGSTIAPLFVPMKYAFCHHTVSEPATLDAVHRTLVVEVYQMFHYQLMHCKDLQHSSLLHLMMPRFSCIYIAKLYCEWSLSLKTSIFLSYNVVVGCLIRRHSPDNILMEPSVSSLKSTIFPDCQQL